MEKKEIIERTKRAYQFYKENKIYQAFKEIYPVAQIVKTDKVQKLYKVLILKAKKLLEDLYNNKEYNKIEEIEYMFFERVNIPEITEIFNKVKEERKRILEEIENEQPSNEFAEPDSQIFNQNDKTLSENFDERESESFEFDADNFKLSSFSEDEMGEQDVNALIQKGVSLYEVGDIENALIVWEQALKLQPGNEFLKEYIANARNELGVEEGDANDSLEQKEVETFSTDTMVDTEDNESEEREIVFENNELSGELKRAIAIARSGDVERAKVMLKTLLENNSIDHDEYTNTLKYISRIENEVGSSIIKNKIKNMIEDKEFENALSYFKKHKNKLDVEEANRIEQYIIQKKQEHAVSQSLELELDLEEEPTRKISVESTGKIKREISRPVPSHKTRTKKRKTNTNLIAYFKTTFFFILLIIILAIVIFYGIKAIRSNIQPENTAFDIQSFQLQELENQKKTNFKKYIKEARNYFDLGEYLFAYYTYLHAERYGKLNEQHIGFLSRARRLMKQEGINKRKEKRLAELYYKKGNYEKAIPHFKALLSENPENLEIKKKLFNCYKKTAIKYALENNILKSKTYFNYALVLNRNDKEVPKHIKVLERYLKGKINQRLLTQWFYFYIK